MSVNAIVTELVVLIAPPSLPRGGNGSMMIEAVVSGACYKSCSGADKSRISLSSIS